MNLRSDGDRETCRFRELLRRDGHRVRRTVLLVVPHDAAQLRLFLIVREVSAFLLKLFQQLVEDRSFDDQIAVSRASRPEIRRLGQASVMCGFRDVRRLVDDHRRVAGAHAVSWRTRAVCGADHWLAAGSHDQIGPRHQRLRHRNVDLGQALQDVGGRAFSLQRFAHQAHRFKRRLLRTRMRREDDYVTRLDPVDRIAGRGEVRVRRGDDAGDDPCRLAVLDDALFGQFLDYAYALLAERVAQHAANLHALAHSADRVAQAALVNTHLDQSRKRLLVGDRPGHGLAKAIDSCLIVGLDNREGFARTLENCVQFLLLFLGDCLLYFGSGHRVHSGC